MCGAKGDVRFTLESGHVLCNSGWPLNANSSWHRNATAGSHLRRHHLRGLASPRLPADRQTRTAADARIRKEFTLGPSNRLVAAERVALTLEPEPCLESRTAEVVA